MNKKAGIFGIITFVAGSLVVLLFLAGMIYMSNQMTTNLQIAGQRISTNTVNLTDAVNKTIVPFNASLSQLHWISFVLLFSLIFVIVLECYFVRSSPIVFFVHILVILLAIVASIYISNYYETLMATGILATTLLGFKASSNLILYLPLWVSIIGFIGLVAMAISANKDPKLKGVDL